MDLKGRDPVKKALCALFCFLMVFVFVSCTGQEVPPAEQDGPVVDSLYEFKNENELASYLWENREGHAKALIEYQKSNGTENGVTVYSPAVVPEGYRLKTIDLPSYSSHISYRYGKDDREFEFVFDWNFQSGGVGEEALRNVIESLELSQIEGLDGVWGVQFPDTADETFDASAAGTCMMFFERDGYLFQINVAKEDLKTICENGKIAVQSNFFPFP